jgi:NADPH:quinone reductase-like Zn-dependent oxidoreductase
MQTVRKPLGLTMSSADVDRAGYNVVTTCSPANAELCKSLGASATFDYHEDTCAEQILKHTDGQLRLAWDTVGSPSSTEICMQALTRDGKARYGTILFNEISRTDVQYTTSFLVTFLGEAFDKFGKHIPAVPEDFEFARHFTSLVDELLEKKRLRALPTRVLPGGLDGITAGLDMIRNGQVSGCKLVVRVGRTE